MPANPSQLLAKLPWILKWISGMPAAHAARVRTVDLLGVERLPWYYPADLLRSTKVIAVPRAPMPSLRSMGLPEFGDFEAMDAAGITYPDMFFVREESARDESLHFHELVHVVQWRILGAERFLLAYALGHLASGGYRTNPLEVRAYDLQAQFDRRVAPFDAVARIEATLDAAIPATPHGLMRPSIEPI